MDDTAPGSRHEQIRPPQATAAYQRASAEESASGNRRWWDQAAPSYLAEHGTFLGDDRFLWGPEGLDEAQAGLLGDVHGRDVLEIGSGAAQCARWLASQGARVVASDLSGGMLAQARALQARPGSPRPSGLVQADARRLPFADATFDLAFSSYGALPFVADPEQVIGEVVRVLRPGGGWVFSITHPIRWAFPDDPGPAGLTAGLSYFDRTPYVEQDEHGRVLYSEHHRTLGDRIRDLVAAGLRLEDLLEPEWPQDNDMIWGGWSPMRGRLLPGTAIFVTRKPT
jgi:ubiquinone/menaquinone biosynthesis C-methylase UbiE